MSEPYSIRYSRDAADFIRSLRAYDRRRVLDEIQLHLTHAPRFESESRIKLMRQPFWSTYRLRVGDFRIFFDLDDEARIVDVSHVLRKGTDPTPEDAP